MKRMMHPQHGFHHAYDTNEETRMRANGWVDEESPEEAEKPKRGRPRKTEESPEEAPEVED